MPPPGEERSRTFAVSIRATQCSSRHPEAPLRRRGKRTPGHPTWLPGGAVVAGRLRLDLECPAFLVDLGAVRGDLGRLLLGRPPERRPDERGHGFGRLSRCVASEQAGPCAVVEEVVERDDHFVTCRVHRLGAQVGQTRNERLTERRIVGNERDDRRRLCAEAARQVITRRGIDSAWIDVVPAVCAVQAEPLRGALRGSTEVAQHLVDGVLCHAPPCRHLPPATVTRPLADRVTRWRRERSAVFMSFADCSNGLSPAHVPTTSDGLSTLDVESLKLSSR